MVRRSMISSVVVLAAVWLGAGLAGSADPALRLSLKGYDPVAYFTIGQPSEGKQAFETAFDGARYRFVSADNMAMFNGDPDRYVPQFAGSCAMGIALGTKIEADPLAWKIIDGKLYVYSGSKAMDRAQAEGRPAVEKANANWQGLRDRPFR